ncbi:hypothetical protein F4859DRAFT_438566 [Xylaria cf. heliscus]|nr:hypothetical protein F4859DRAFT_438566 [Xylaria cf. heliscus]
MKTPSALEITAYAGGFPGSSDNSVEFAQLLVEHGAPIDPTASCRKCRHLKLISPIALSIARGNNRTTEFLIENDANIPNLYKHSEVLGCRCCGFVWSTGGVGSPFVTHCTPLHVAIVSGNNEMIGRLLQPILSHPRQIFESVFKDALITSCLVGDVDTASKLLAHRPGIRILAIDQWALGLTALVATA